MVCHEFFFDFGDKPAACFALLCERTEVRPQTIIRGLRFFVCYCNLDLLQEVVRLPPNEKAAVLVDLSAMLAGEECLDIIIIHGWGDSGLRCNVG